MCPTAGPPRRWSGSSMTTCPCAEPSAADLHLWHRSASRGARARGRRYRRRVSIGRPGILARPRSGLFQLDLAIAVAPRVAVSLAERPGRLAGLMDLERNEPLRACRRRSVRRAGREASAHQVTKRTLAPGRRGGGLGSSDGGSTSRLAHPELGSRRQDTVTIDPRRPWARRGLEAVATACARDVTSRSARLRRSPFPSSGSGGTSDQHDISSPGPGPAGTGLKRLARASGIFIGRLLPSSARAHRARALPREDLRLLETTPHDGVAASFSISIWKGMNGFEVKERLVAGGIPIPIIFMTAQ